jgi:hypothetical protein
MQCTATNINVSHDKLPRERELPAGCAHAGMTVDDLGVSLFFFFPQVKDELMERC